MAKWQFTKGLHDLGGGCFAYLQPDGGWGWSNAGLVVDGEENLLTPNSIFGESCPTISASWLIASCNFSECCLFRPA
jgi:hypothetical protein